MSTRLAGIPIDHVVAEITAFPLVSEAALGLSVTNLDPSLRPRSHAPGGESTPSTRDLWRAAEKAVVGSFPAFSVDESVSLRDRIWFNGEVDRPVPLHAYLRRTARENLVVEGTTAVPRVISDKGRETTNDALHAEEALARWRWRWLSLAVPPDLLLTALGDRERAIPSRIEPLSPALVNQLYDHSFAEMHMHLGAGLEFPLMWISVLNGIGQSAVKHDILSSPGSDLDEGRDLGPWLIRAAMARFLLATYLTRSRGTQNLMQFVTEVVGQWVSAAHGVTNTAVLMQGLADLLVGTLSTTPQTRDTDFARRKALYARMTRVMPDRFPQDLDGAMTADPIAPFMGTHLTTGVSAEMRFVAAALAHLETKPQGPDPIFEILFWQVVRVRALLYRHFVHRPMTPGLTWFVRFYERMAPVRRPISYGLRLASAARVCGQGLRLKSLEVRTSPDASTTDTLSQLRQLDQQAKALRVAGISQGDRYLAAAHDLEDVQGRFDQSRDPLHRAAPTAGTGGMYLSNAGDLSSVPRDVTDPWSSDIRQRDPEFGVVYHFIKNRGGGALEGAPTANWLLSHADPEFHGQLRTSTNPTGYRYARYYNGREREALSLIWALRNMPLTLEVVRGLDVCTDELGVPFWVLSPLLRGVRRAGQEASNALHRVTGVAVPPLRMTVHAGEDFVHLLTGLRLVDEAIQLFGLREGDRIGHALSLGVEPRDWVRRAGRIAMPCETRLLDLAWEWMWYRRSGLAIPPRRRTVLEHEIARLSEKVFKRRYLHYDIGHLIQDLNDGRRLWQMGFPNGPVPNISNRISARNVNEGEEDVSDEDATRSRDHLLLTYLTDVGVFRRGRQIEWVEPEADGAEDALAAIQATMRSHIASRGITIEVNPSSNLLIGDLADLSRHPLWRLQPPQGEGDAPAVSVCLGSDDPLTFGTSLPNEYQLVHDALVMAGVSTEQARRWLEHVRSRGLESRFTLPVRSNASLTSLRNPSLSQPSLLLSA